MKVCLTTATINNSKSSVRFGNKYNQNSNHINLDQFKKNNPCIADYEIDISNGDLKKIYLRKPVPVWEVFDSIVNSDDVLLKSSILRNLHTMEELSYMSENLKQMKNLSEHRVKSLEGIGAFAFAFETEDGKILKVTPYQHFPNGRKPDDFDLPIEKTGNKNGVYYYLEAKVSNENITDNELKEFINYIREKGYTVRDYIGFTADEEYLNKAQFGKTPDGKLYLIDPGCAVAPYKRKFAITSLIKKLWSFFKHK